MMESSKWNLLVLGIFISLISVSKSQGFPDWGPPRKPKVVQWQFPMDERIQCPNPSKTLQILYLVLKSKFAKNIVNLQVEKVAFARDWKTVMVPTIMNLYPDLRVFLVWFDGKKKIALVSADITTTLSSPLKPFLFPDIDLVAFLHCYDVADTNWEKTGDKIIVESLEVALKEPREGFEGQCRTEEECELVKRVIRFVEKHKPKTLPPYAPLGGVAAKGQYLQ